MAEQEWRVTLHATNGILAGCGLSLRQCPICSALVVEDFMPQHEAWHEAIWYALAKALAAATSERPVGPLIDPLAGSDGS